jgi:hypothetical protein
MKTERELNRAFLLPIFCVLDDNRPLGPLAAAQAFQARASLCDFVDFHLSARSESKNPSTANFNGDVCLRKNDNVSERPRECQSWQGWDSGWAGRFSIRAAFRGIARGLPDWVRRPGTGVAGDAKTV